MRIRRWMATMLATLLVVCTAANDCMVVHAEQEGQEVSVDTETMDETTGEDESTDEPTGGSESSGETTAESGATEDTTGESEITAAGEGEPTGDTTATAEKTDGDTGNNAEGIQANLDSGEEINETEKVEKIGAYFSIRLDGIIPVGTQSQKDSAYTPKIWVDEAIETTISDIGNVFDVAGVDSCLKNRPSDEQLKAALDKKGVSFDPASQSIVWYVIKWEKGDQTWHVDGVIPSNADSAKVTLTYHANAPEGTTVKKLSDPMLCDKNTTITLAEKPTCEGCYAFKNWNTKEDGTGTSYDANSSIELMNDMDLYAQWEPYDTLNAALFVYDPSASEETIKGIYDNEKNSSVSEKITHVKKPFFTIEIGTATVPKSTFTQYNSVKANSFGEKVGMEYAYDYNYFSQFEDADGETLHLNFNGVEYSVKKDDIIWYVVKNESDGWHVDGYISDTEDPNEPPSDDPAGDPEKPPVEDEPTGDTEKPPVEDEPIGDTEKPPVEDEPTGDTEKPPVEEEDALIPPVEDKPMTSPATEDEQITPPTVDDLPIVPPAEEIIPGPDDTTPDIIPTEDQPPLFELVILPTDDEEPTIELNIGDDEPDEEEDEPPVVLTLNFDPPVTEEPVQIAVDPTPVQGDVLGARRGVEADSGSVLGASRVKAVLGARRGAQTGDENAMAVYMTMMGISASFAALYTIGIRRKKSSDK